MAIDVFLSAGRPANQEQEDFLRAVERYLQQNDFNPRTPGRTHLANTQPLKAVEKCMRTCKGIVVVAYERLYAPVAIERRGGPDRADWNDAIVPTVWNQIEGAMAYTLGLPVMVIAQKGLRDEALLENKYDWNVQWVDLNQNSLATPAFNSVFNDWRSDIAAKEKATAASVAPAPAPQAAPVDPGGRTVGQLIGDLKPGQAWKVGTSLFVLIAGAFGLGYKTGLRDAPRGASSSPAVRTSALVEGWLSDSAVAPLLEGRASLRVDSTSAAGRWAALTLSLDGTPSAARIDLGNSLSFLLDGRKHVLTVMRVEPHRVRYTLAEAR